MSRHHVDVSSSDDEDFDTPPLYADNDADGDAPYEGGPIFSAQPRSKTLNLAALLRAPDLRIPVLVVAFTMIAQQFSGINAVLYYSNKILGKTLPELGPYVSLAITVVNVAMTFPAIVLIEVRSPKTRFRSLCGADVCFFGVY